MRLDMDWFWRKDRQQEEEKQREEVVEFLKNLGIEYRFSCYAENNPEGCDLLGDYMQNIKQDHVKAAKVYRDNCVKNKNPMSCTKFGVYTLKGAGSVEKNPTEAADFFDKACTYTHKGKECKFGCYYSGQMLTCSDPQYSEFVQQNIPKALKHLERGCDLGLPDSCFNLSTIYLFGKHGVEKQLKKAFEAAQKGCELDHLQSCNNLANMYFRGEGTEKNEDLGRKFKEKTLDMINSIKKGQNLDMQRF